MQTVTGEVRRFDGPGGWYYVDVPEDVAEGFEERRGFVPVVARIGDTEWRTSLLPKGDGTKFLALKASVRKARDLDEGDEVTVLLAPP
ncbi:DUF1905 domain-containing protein [Saccharothrix sp. NRRL B-16314]|uniref:DUF1905 domain-containing protein n=1 Tax=Saccharothrix sp. NRRL B-16314 TaxID=1463825 RepID=UPI0018CC59C8|nr:DUF1905 domain-containing protein [Saccharothrix sp. NRRL B-16314]